MLNLSLDIKERPLQMFASNLVNSWMNENIFSFLTISKLFHLLQKARRESNVKLKCCFLIVSFTPIYWRLEIFHPGSWHLTLDTILTQQINELKGRVCNIDCNLNNESLNLNIYRNLPLHTILHSQLLKARNSSPKIMTLNT